MNIAKSHVRNPLLLKALSGLIFIMTFRPTVARIQNSCRALFGTGEIVQIVRHVQLLQPGVVNMKMSGNCLKGMLHNMFGLHKTSNICLQHGGGHSIYAKVSHVIFLLSVLDYNSVRMSRLSQ
jgi:hypothetical protein